MAHVFVSYSHQDNEFAQLLRMELMKAGITTWLALENLKAGEEWREGIDTAIRNSYAMIVVISPDSERSIYVTYEWAFAYGNGLQVVPVMYKTVQGKVHPRLENLQYEDFTSAKNRPWDRLVFRLKEIQQIVESKPTNPRVLRAIETLVSSYKLEERVEAVKALGVFKEPFTVTVLLENLYDEYHAVRVECARSLGELGNSAAIPQLLEVAANIENAFPLRVTAIQAIGNIGDTSVASDLIKLLDEPNDAIRIAAIKVLNNLATSNLFEPLFRLLASLLGTQQEAGQESLEEDVIELDGHYKEDYDNPLIVELFNALQNHVTPDSSATLFPLMEHSHQTIREQAVRIVAKAPGREAIRPLLQRTLRDRDWRTRRIALDGLSRIEYTEKIKDMLGALSSSDASIRNHAILYFEDRLGLEGLILALGEPTSEAYWGVAERIEEIVRDTKAEALIIHYLNSYSERTRALLAEVLGKVGAKSYCSNIVPLINDAYPFVRGLAIRALARLGCKGVTRKLRSKLDDQDKIFSNAEDTVSDYAAIALGKSGHHSATPFLLGILRRSNSILCEEAAAQLCYLNAVEVVSDLREILHSKSGSSRKSALVALGHLVNGVDVNSLLDMLDNSDNRIAASAVQELSELEPPFGLIIALGHEPLVSYWLIAEELKYTLPNDNPALIRLLLSDPEFRVRAYTAYCIGMRPDIGCFSELSDLLSDEVSFVCGQAVQALGRLGCIQSLEVLRARLEDTRTIYSNSDIRVCDYSAIALSRIGYVEKDKLFDVVELDNSKARGEAIELLRNVLEEQDIPRIETLTKHSKPTTRVAASILLGAFVPDHTVVPMLVKLLDDSNDEVVTSTLRTLAQFDEISLDICSKLAALLSHSSKSVVAQTLNLIGSFVCRDLLEQILEFPTGGDYQIQYALYQAVKQLAPVVDTESLNNRLIGFIESGNQNQRTVALWILEETGNVEIARKLLKYMEGLDDALDAVEISNVLSVIGDPSLESELHLLLGDRKIFMRSEAARLIGTLNIDTLRPVILEGLNSQDEVVVLAIMEALERVGQASDIGYLLPFLNNEEESLVAQAIITLGRIGDKSVTPHLRAMFSTANYFILENLIKTLVILQDVETLPYLEQIAGDIENRREYERIAAIKAIGALGSGDKHGLMLNKYLNDSSCDIRIVAAEALGNLKAITSVQALIRKLGDRCATFSGRICDVAADSLGCVDI